MYMRGANKDVLNHFIMKYRCWILIQLIPQSCSSYATEQIINIKTSTARKINHPKITNKTSSGNGLHFFYLFFYLPFVLVIVPCLWLLITLRLLLDGTMQHCRDGSHIFSCQGLSMIIASAG